MATYPVFVVSFTTKKDGDVVASADPNTIQNEVAAIETTLGAMPHVSTTNSSSGTYSNTGHTYASVSARIANVEQGVVADTHTQYVHISGGDVIAPAAGTIGLTIQAPVSPTTTIFQVKNGAGNPVLYVDSGLVPRLISGSPIVDTTSAQTLTTKTLTTPIIAQISNTGTLTLPTSTDTLVGRATTDTLTNKTLTTPVIAQIVNTGTLTLPTSTDTLVGRATTDTLTNKTLTSPTISTILNGAGTLTLPTSTDTLVGRATTDTLTNKTLTAPSIASISNGGTITLPTGTDTLVGRNTVDTLTNKTINLTSNTLVGTTVQFNAALSDDSFATLTGVQTITNKTLTAPKIATISNTGTLTLPTSTDTLVGRATTDTLTNKTLTAPSISTISNTGTLTLPTSTDTLVGRATTDTLTNKTLTAPTINTPTINTPTITNPTITGTTSGPSWSASSAGILTGTDVVIGAVSLPRGIISVASTTTSSGNTASTTVSTWFSGSFNVVNGRRYLMVATAESINWSGTGSSGDTEALAQIVLTQTVGTAVAFDSTPFQWIGLTRGGNNACPPMIVSFTAQATGSITFAYQFGKGNTSSTTVQMVAAAGRPGSIILYDVSSN